LPTSSACGAGIDGRPGVHARRIRCRSAHLKQIKAPLGDGSNNAAKATAAIVGDLHESKTIGLDPCPCAFLPRIGMGRRCRSGTWRPSRCGRRTFCRRSGRMGTASGMERQRQRLDATLQFGLLAQRPLVARNLLGAGRLVVDRGRRRMALGSAAAPAAPVHAAISGQRRVPRILSARRP
jgi:hypothetical protein